MNPGSFERKSVFELMLSYKESAYNKQGNQIIPQQQYIGENGEMKFLKMELDEMELDFKSSGNIVADLKKKCFNFVQWACFNLNYLIILLIYLVLSLPILLNT